MKHVVGRHPVPVILSVLTLSIGSAGLAAAAELVNGGFETGNLAGWTSTTTDPGGEWAVYSGTPVQPVERRMAGGVPFFPPPEGTFAVWTTQDDESNQLLYQDVALEAGQGHVLRMFVYYRNFAPEFFTPQSLDADDSPNQQYRIDVIRPDVPIDSVSEGDVIRTLFRTDPGDPNELAPTLMEFDLSDLAGQTIRLRFAVAVTVDFINAGVDAVGIASGRCGGKPATVVGTEGDDVLRGTSAKDFIAGLGGDDEIRGKGKNDALCGGPGRDFLLGGAGEDLLVGGPGKDDLVGSSGFDRCKGGGGTDEETSC